MNLPSLTRRDWALTAGACTASGLARYATAVGAAPASAESRTLKEVHRAAFAGGAQLIVYDCGDSPNGDASLEQAFVRRFPRMMDRPRPERVRDMPRQVIGPVPNTKPAKFDGNFPDGATS